MNPAIVGTIGFACMLEGAFVGMGLRTRLPEGHLDDASRDSVKLGIGLVATMTALVLGLVIASARSSFDAADTAVKHTAIDILTLDRLLARYGPETGEIRAALQRALAARIDLIWAQTLPQRDRLSAWGATSEVERVADAIRSLTPRDDAQRWLKSRAVDNVEALLQVRWLVLASGGTSVPRPFLVLLLSWLTITFACFGLIAPRNATVLGVHVVCALCAGSAVFLVLEMDGPFDGLLKVSADPLRYAGAHLNQ